MKQSNIVWNTETLDEFLSSPLKFIPGTSMGVSGIKNLQVRRDLIAYLKTSTNASECM